MQFFLDGKAIDLPAVRLSKTITREGSAWRGGDWITVRMVGPLDALRVHTDGKRVDLRDVRPTSSKGAWILIGDVIQTSSQITQARALPGLFTATSQVQVLSTTVLNIGLCGQLFGFPGGGWQAEYVNGPEFKISRLPNVWMNRSGSA